MGGWFEMFLRACAKHPAIAPPAAKWRRGNYGDPQGGFRAGPTRGGGETKWPPALLTCPRGDGGSPARRRAGRGGARAAANRGRRRRRQRMRSASPPPSRACGADRTIELCSAGAGPRASPATIDKAAWEIRTLPRPSADHRARPFLPPAAHPPPPHRLSPPVTPKPGRNGEVLPRA